MKKIIVALTAITATLSLLTGCTRSGSESTMPANAGKTAAAVSTEAESGQTGNNSDRTLSIGIGSEISNIVPMSNNVSVANRDGLLIFALYDPLLWYDTTTNELKPWLATEWSTSEDGKELDFTIRDDVYFHNGDKMTTDDVAWSINLIPDNPVTTDQNFPGFDHAEAVDDTHVKVFMKQPFAAAANFFASYHMVMLDKSYQEKVGWEGYINHPIGTGPYKFVSRKIGAEVKMDAFDDYWGGAPDIKHVNLEILPDANSQILSLEAGEVDVLQNVSLDNCAKVEKMDGYKVDYCVSDLVSFISWGTKSKLDTDENLRKAVYSAIDRDTINKVVNKGHTVSCEAIVAPGINCRPDDGTFTKMPKHSVEQAKKYLAKSTYKKGDKLSIICTSGSKEENICKVIQGNLEEAGISAELKAVDGSMHITMIQEGNYDIDLYSTLPSLYDANLIYQYYAPGTLQFENSKFEGKEEMGQLATASLTEMDHDARTEIFRKMINIMNEHCLKPALYQDCNTFCYSEDLKNVKAIPGTNVRVAEWKWK